MNVSTAYLYFCCSVTLVLFHCVDNVLNQVHGALRPSKRSVDGHVQQLQAIQSGGYDEENALYSLNKPMCTNGCDGNTNDQASLASPFPQNPAPPAPNGTAGGNRTAPPAPPAGAPAPGGPPGPNGTTTAAPPRNATTTAAPAPAPATAPPSASAPATAPGTVTTTTYYYVYPQWCVPWCQFYYFQRPRLIFFSWLGLGFGFF